MGFLSGQPLRDHLTLLWFDESFGACKDGEYKVYEMSTQDKGVVNSLLKDISNETDILELHPAVLQSLKRFSKDDGGGMVNFNLFLKVLYFVMPRLNRSLDRCEITLKLASFAFKNLWEVDLLLVSVTVKEATVLVL